MSWLDDAKKEAQKIKSEAEKERLQKYENYKELKRLEYQELLISAKPFHSATSQTKAEIEKFLIYARENGLEVKGPDEDFHYRNESIVGTFFGKWDDSGPTSLDNNNLGWGAWSYLWIVKIPDSCSELYVYLGAKQQNRFFGIVTYWIPTTSLKEVEKEVKDWLVKIYS